MGIVASAVAAKAKTALTYCCVGALSIGVNQVYEKRVKPKAKAKVHKVVKRQAPEPLAISCPSPIYPPIVGAGERVDLASANSLPMGIAAGFVPAAYSYEVSQPEHARMAMAAEVPEPAMIGIFGLGVAGLTTLRRRRQRLTASSGSPSLPSFEPSMA